MYGKTFELLKRPLSSATMALSAAEKLCAFWGKAHSSASDSSP